LLRGAPALGALIVSIALTRWPMDHKVGSKMMWAVAMLGASTVVFGLSTSFVLSLAALVVTGAADSGQRGDSANARAA